MAKIVDNPKRFKVIELSRNEIKGVILYQIPNGEMEAE